MPSVAIIGTRGYPSYYGGFETAVRRLAPYLADHGWDVSVYGRESEPTREGTERDSRVKVVVTSGIESKSLSTLTYGLTATLHAMKARPDVALVMNVANGFWLPLLKLARIPTIVNVDGIEWEREKWGRLAKFVFRTGAKMTGWWGNDLIFDSREIESRWAREFKRAGHFIPYGGDVLDEEVALPDGVSEHKYALVVARFVPENTVGEFFDAVERIAETADVVIVGSSGYGNDLDERARQLDGTFARVHWLGHVRNDSLLHTLWKKAGAYFHGHSVGGTNPALVQAMAVGSPIVARDTIYNREVLNDAALFCKPDPDDIAAKVTRVLNDDTLRTDLASAAERRAAEHYTWDLVNAGYERAIRAQITEVAAS